MKKRAPSKFRVTAMLMCAALLSVLDAVAQDAASPPRAAVTVQLPASVISSGAVVASSSSDRIIGTVGQAIIGVAQSGQARLFEGFWYLKDITAVVSTDRIPTVAKDFALAGYPNPFRNETMLQFRLGFMCDVRIDIYDALGRRVRTFSMPGATSGVHGIRWNARDEFGLAVPSGMYTALLHVTSGAGRVNASAEMTLEYVK